MRSGIALALTLSSAALLVAISPACSSSSSVPAGGKDSGPGEDATKSEGGQKDGGTIDVVQTDSKPSEASTCTDPTDAAGYLGGGGTPCTTCLATKCTGGNLLKQCGCEPSCIQGLQCLDSCIADGGSATGCAIGCIEALDAGAGQTTGGNILACVKETCTVCTATPDSGADGG